jgi:hypothetical protein
MAKRRGRRDTYDEKVKARFDEIAKWCQIGTTNKEIIELLGVSTSAFYRYLDAHGELRELLKSNRRKPVMEIKAALYRRATGFVYEESTTTEDSDGYSKTVTTKKTALPDPASAMILLKHWAKDEGWTNDPQQLEIKKQEMELKKQALEAAEW